jgi:L-lactate dehydrogenase (cytochrome)
MLQARAPSQPLWYQLYVNPNRQLTAEVVQRAEAGGCSAMAITVDAPQLGRRERDMRNKFHTANSAAVQKQHHMQVKKDSGVSASLSSFIDPSLNWRDLPTLRQLTKMKIMLKGVQCGEDAVLAAQNGVDAIILSNHGGRQVDTARSGIEILPEVMSALRAAGLEKRMEVYVDGGVRRGTDIFKALALGAKGVGLGRPILYGLAGYGQAGVERVLELLQQEFNVCMGMMGCRSLADIRPEMVIVDQLGAHTVVDAQMRSRL